MPFDENLVNFHLDKPGIHRPGIIAHQGKVMWKCNVCFKYNPHQAHQCDNCGLKNPAMMGLQR